GDMHAFRQLVERHQRFVYGLAYRLVGTVGDAEDIVQESFVRLWKNLSLYRPETKVSTWLYTIVTNRCLDHLKSRHNKHARRTLNLPGNSETAVSPDQALLHEEFDLALKKASEALSPKQKAVFVLRDIEGLPMSEIGSMLSMSPGKVKSNLYYARKKVGELLTLYYNIK